MKFIFSSTNHVKWLAKRLAVAVLVAAASTAPAYAQLDPLLFLKSSAQPNVLLLVDTSNRMQRDAPSDPANPLATSSYYDTFAYPLDVTKIWQTATLNLTAANTTAVYRRRYNNLTYQPTGNADKFATSFLTVVRDRDAGYSLFEAPTRLSIARAALYQAVNENKDVVRFGLIKMRQSSPAIAAQATSTVVVSDATQNVSGLTEVSAGKWNIARPTVGATNNGAVSAPSASQAALVQASSASANADVLTVLAKDTRSAQTGSLRGLLPAGNDDATTVDAPVKNLLDDAKVEAARLMAINNDPTCRNTVAILVVGGGEGGTAAGQSNATMSATASGFVAVATGLRVPIYVIAIAPPSADVASLQAVASNSGGQYFEITKAQIDAALASPYLQATAGVTAPAGTVIVPEVVRAVNIAIQHTFASSADFDAVPTASLPFGPSTEFQTTSPIVGTVNFQGAKDISGAALLPDPSTVKDRAANVIPQRSNLMITSGFKLPGFDLSLRGFRVYQAQPDATQPSGYKFISDNTFEKRLWIASAPAAASRNLFTALPDGSMIPFTAANAATLGPYMNLSSADATDIINFVRSQPLGAVIDSTPAIMNPPSLDPPPDDTYPGFAVRNADRRTIIFTGTNRGIMEAIDARIGTELWGFIPFNLLPKLRTMRDGESVGSFDYFADGSPKISDVKLADGTWHTYLLFGEGPGGTFYQTVDVTLADMATTGGISPIDDTPATLLNYFSSSTRMPLKWSYPLYSNFDSTSSTPTMPYGDLKVTASLTEKTVGQTWSDPAIGQIQASTSPYVVLTGSGFLPRTTELQANRTPKLAGTTFYMFNINDGALLDSRDVGNDGLAETVDNCAAAAVNDCTILKNALQTDPVATGPSDSRFIIKAYLGDLDGRVWRFDIGLNPSLAPIFTTTNATKLYDDTTQHQPIFASMATVNVGTQQYIFFGTGSDLLASSGVSQSYKLMGVLDNGATGTVTFNPILLKVDNSGSDEKVSAFPAVAGDIVFFTTTTTTPATPCTPPRANLYALTFIGGAAYDTNADGKFSNQDSTLVTSITGVRATAPFIVDQHLVFAAGGKVQMFGDQTAYNNGIGQAGVRILSWREIR